jgi:hypothetical protein
MREHLTASEKLARRICWLEFAKPRKDTTEAEYWRGVHPDKKAEYIQEATYLEWMVDLLCATDASWELLMAVRNERKQRRTNSGGAARGKANSPPTPGER